MNLDQSVSDESQCQSSVDIHILYEQSTKCSIKQFDKYSTQMSEIFLAKHQAPDTEYNNITPQILLFVQTLFQMIQQLHTRRDNLRTTIRNTAKHDFLQKHRHRLLSEAQSHPTIFMNNMPPHSIHSIKSIIDTESCECVLQQLADYHDYISSQSLQKDGQKTLSERHQIISVLLTLIRINSGSQQHIVHFIITNLVKAYFDSGCHDMLFEVFSHIKNTSLQLQLLHSILNQINSTHSMGINQVIMVQLALDSAKLAQQTDCLRNFVRRYYTSRQSVERVVQSVLSIEDPEHSLELLYLINDLMMAQPCCVQAFMECGLYRRLLVYILHGYTAQKDIAYRILHNLCLVKEYRLIIQKQQFLKKMIQRFAWQKLQIQEIIVCFVSSYFQMLSEPQDLDTIQEWCTGQHVVALFDWVSMSTSHQIINSFSMGIRNLYVLGTEQHQNMYQECQCGTNRFTRMLQRTGRLQDIEEMCLS